MSDDLKKVQKAQQSYLLAGFKAGWAAAMQTIGDQYEKAGEKEAAATMRRWAGMPPPVEMADLNTPEGRAMKAESEVVYAEVLGRGSRDGR